MLARWFVLTMLALVPIAIAVTLWALSFADREPLSAAERRPAGDASVTVARGAAELGAATTSEPGPGCFARVLLVGDDGARAALARALGATCQLLGSEDLPAATRGLTELDGGRVRLAVFAFAGVESSARVEDGAVVLELNARYAFEDATRAAPEVVQQLALIGAAEWPGATPTAASALVAAAEQAAACARLSLPAGEPRGCLDARAILAEDDPLAALAAAGYVR